ncbi:MAG: hypothetical protein ACI9FD_003370, partial [Gammaproteobacteria bacterium]
RWLSVHSGLTTYSSNPQIELLLSQNIGMLISMNWRIPGCRSVDALCLTLLGRVSVVIKMCGTPSDLARTLSESGDDLLFIKSMF